MLKAANFQQGQEHVSVKDSVLQFYTKDVDSKKLITQLNLIPDFVAEMKKMDEYKCLKEITNLKTLADLLKGSELSRALFSEVVKLIKIHFTVPVSTATAERSFSTLRRIKTYLRSTMTQERLNNVMILNGHNDRTDALDLTAVAKDFSQANDRRRNFFWQLLNSNLIYILCAFDVYKIMMQIVRTRTFTYTRITRAYMWMF